MLCNNLYIFMKDLNIAGKCTFLGGEATQWASWVKKSINHKIKSLSPKLWKMHQCVLCFTRFSAGVCCGDCVVSHSFVHCTNKQVVRSPSNKPSCIFPLCHVSMHTFVLQALLIFNSQAKLFIFFSYAHQNLQSKIVCNTAGIFVQEVHKKQRWCYPGSRGAWYWFPVKKLLVKSYKGTRLIGCTGSTHCRQLLPWGDTGPHTHTVIM